MKITPILRSLAIGLIFICLFCATRPTQARTSLEALGPDALTITLVTPAYQIETDDQGFQHIHMDGFGDDLTPRNFLLPVQNRHYALPPDALPGSLELVVESTQTETLPGVYRFAIASEPQPDCSGVESPCQVDEIQSEANTNLEPGVMAPLARISGQGQMRKWQIVDVEFAPFQFDPTTGALTLARQVKLQVRYRREAASLDALLMQDDVMDVEASEMLENAEEATGWYQAAADLTAPNLQQESQAEGAFSSTSTCMSGTCNYVIITTNEIVSNSLNLNAFIISKENHGHSVWVVTEDIYDAYTGQAPNTRADRIRAFLKANYLNFGMKFVLLIGDPDPVDPYNAKDFIGDVPMKMTYPRLHANTYTQWSNVPTDYYFSDLTGNWDLVGDQLYAAWPEDLQAGGVDWFPEVYVGRIPSYAGSPNRWSDLNHILLKLIDYENRIFAFDSWKDTSVLLPMSFSKPGYDGAQMAEELKPVLSTYGFTNLYTMYQQGNSVCHPNSALNSSQELLGGSWVRDRWYITHFGMVVWWGHGSSQEASVGYHDDGANVDCWDGAIMSSNLTGGLNDNYPSFVFMNSCLNGTPEDVNNLGYANLRKGAVSTVSASRVSWFSSDQHNNFVNGQTNASIAYRYAERLARSWISSWALRAAKTEGASPSNMNYYANRLVFNLYGDPAMQLVHGTSSLNTPPGWPGNLVITQSTYQSMWDLEWAKFTGGEAGFMLQRADKYKAFVTTDYFSAGSVRGRAQKPDFCGETMYYRIVAYNKWGESNSTEAAKDTRPCQPWNTEASIVSSGVKIEWDKGWGDVETGYRVWRRIVGNAEMTQIGSDLPKSQLSLVDTSAACGTSYKYWVQAFNATGESDYSNATMASTNPCPPTPPSNVHKVSATQSTITLAWNDNSDTEVNFTIYRATSASGPWTWLLGLPANTTSYTDPGPLTCGSSYYYQVEAQIKYGKGTSPVSPQMTTLACSKPAAPTSLAASTTQPSDPKHVYLTWNDQSSNETGFRIERSDNNGPWTLIGSTGPNEASFRDPGVCSAAPRRYRVRAYNSTTSDYSNIAEATLTTCYVYGISANAKATLGSAVHLGWQDQNDPVAITEYFQIYYSDTPNARDSWELLEDNIPPEDRSYDHTSLPCERGASYLIRAIARMVSGAVITYTSELNGATPMPCAPASLGVLPPRQNTLDLYWVDQSDFETGFVIEKSSPAAPGWAEVATRPAGGDLYRVTGLACGTDYDFRMRSYVDEDTTRLYSDYSGTFHISTLECSITTPITLTVNSVTRSAIQLDWNDVGSNESGYRVWREAGDAFVEVGSTLTDVLTYQDSPVTCGSDYRYYVTAENNSGESQASNFVTAGTLPCTPTGVAVAWAGDEQVNVTWVDNNANETSFTVQTSSGPTFSSSDTKHSYNTLANTTSLSVPAPGCGTPLYFRVYATNAWGKSSNSVSVAFTSLCPPAAPTNLAAWDVGASLLTLQWAHSGGGISGFEVLASFEGSFDWHTMAQVDPTTRRLQVSGLLPGSRVYFRVRAYQDGGPSTDSALLVVDLKEALFLPMIRR